MTSRVTGPREARAAVVALRSVDADVRKAVNASVRSVVTPLWKSVVQVHATSKMDTRVLATGSRVNVGAKPTLVAASSNRALRGGLVPAQRWRAFEFGAVRDLRTTYEGRSPKGTRYPITRRTRRQLPKIAPTGRVLYPSVADIGPRVFALWAQTSIREIFTAFQKGE